MANKAFYKITIKSWKKYNATLKPGHKKTMIANNFCHDSKLGVLPLPVRWLYLGMLLTCGDHTTDTIEMTEKQVRDLLESSWSTTRALDSLQELQLLSYDKIEPFINRIEKKGIEKKGKELQAPVKPEVLIPDDSTLPKNNPELNRKIKTAYREAIFARHKVEPVFNAKTNALISNLGKRLGVDAIEVVKFYVSHNDQQFVRSMHDMGILLSKAESMHLQWQKGDSMTSTKARQVEKQSGMQELFQAIKDGGKV